ncbi:HAD-IIIA family hydrolase [Bacteroidia bacterium]|nr:HAD-IIIA family hydrolase [Bacteroidia bacterium]MDB9881622.1 HAD-IIIA family hydrolase [Bacteroidia bacterium]MDC1395070.1 HAD-IIIA family hydrolase [Bacteroidia bacterium]
MILDKLTSISTFILDVDGVLTDGSILATEEAEQNRTFNIKDGFAIHHAINSGYDLIVISGGRSESVVKRLDFLGLQHIYIGVKDKREFLNNLKAELHLNLNECLYMGDDLIDLSVMQMCGVKVCPNDAVWAVQEVADIVTKSNGGEGAVREILEKVLIMQDKWVSTEHTVL